MKNYVAVSFIGTAIAASSVALAAVAGAAPSGPSSVDQTVQTLQSSGYNVIVNRLAPHPFAMHGQRGAAGADAFHRGFAGWRLNQYDGHIADRLCRRDVPSDLHNR